MSMFDPQPKKLILPGDPRPTWSQGQKVNKLPERARKVGERWFYGTMWMWGQGGGVHIIDEAYPEGTDGHYVTMTLRKWRERIDGFENMIRELEAHAHEGTGADVAHQRQQADVYKSALDAMKDIERTCDRQGDLTRAEVREYYRKHVAPVRKFTVVPSSLLPD